MISRLNKPLLQKSIFFLQYVPIAKDFPTSERQFQHVQNHPCLVAMAGEHEGLQIAVALNVLPVVSALRLDEQLEFLMDGVDVVHGVLGIPHPPCLRRRVRLTRHAERLLCCRMGRLPVVMDGGRLSYVGDHFFHLPGLEGGSVPSPMRSAPFPSVAQ